MFDKDGGGSIDAGELKELLASVGQMPTDAELAGMIAAVDADGTGDIDFTEFAALMAHKMQGENSEDSIAQAFQVFDQVRSPSMLPPPPPSPCARGPDPHLWLTGALTRAICSRATA